jgi:sulfatase modifying factor 1
MIRTAALTSIVVLGMSAWTPVPDDKRPEKITNSIDMKLASIPAGEFLMGSPENEEHAREFDAKVRINEKQHRVRITKPFYLGVYDVTRGQFAKFVADTNYKTEAEKDGKGAFGFDAKGRIAQKPEYTWRNPGLGLFGNQQTDDHPVVDVSWNDAQAFCQWLSKKEGKTYRLPTGAEWEYACRAGTTTPFHFGDKLNGDNANCNGSNYPYGTATKGAYLKWTTPVGSYKPNAFGLYDMHGNVQQWCADWFDEKYYANSPVDDPQGPPNPGLFRMSRMTCGGGWNSYAVDCRSAARGDSPLTLFDIFTGFRVVLAR